MSERTLMIDEKCGCGADFHYRSTTDYRAAAAASAAEWREGHRHIEATVTPADDLAQKTAGLAYRAARIDEEAALMRRDAAKRALRALTAAPDDARGAKCEPCAAYQHGGCQGHRVPCSCTCGEASDGGRLG